MKKQLSIKSKISYLLYNILAKYLPRTYMPYSIGSKFIRYYLIKNFINKCGINIKIETNVLLSPFIEIGDNVEINENVRIREYVTIGNDVLIAPNVQLLSTNHEFLNADIPIRLQGGRFGSIEIGDDVWIGTGVIVLTNIKIGKGVVIGAGSIVTRDVPDYAVVVGNPAKIVKYRSSHKL